MVIISLQCSCPAARLLVLPRRRQGRARARTPGPTLTTGRAASAMQGGAPPPALALGPPGAENAESPRQLQLARAEREWRDGRYQRWQEAGQAEAPGLRGALCRLALASALLQPRVAADFATSVAPDVVAVVGAHVNRALGFCGALRGHASNVTSASFSPDGQKIVSGSGDNTVRVWSAVTGECEQTLEGHTDTVLSASFSPETARRSSRGAGT